MIDEPKFTPCPQLKALEHMTSCKGLPRCPDWIEVYRTDIALIRFLRKHVTERRT